MYSRPPIRRWSIRNISDLWSVPWLRPRSSEAFGHPSRFPAKFADIDTALTSSLGDAQTEILGFRTQKRAESPMDHTSPVDRWSSRWAALEVPAMVLLRQRISDPRVSSQASVVF